MKLRSITLPFLCAVAFTTTACHKEGAPIAGGDSARSTMPPNTNGAKDVPNAGAMPNSAGGQVVDDSAITAKVKSALAAEKEVKNTTISVETQQGRVKLSGSVANANQIDRAVQVAQRVPGVKEVVNQLSAN